MFSAAVTLESLNNRKVVARLWLLGQQIFLLGARPHFHHHKLLERAQRDCTRSWPTATSLLGQRRPVAPAPRARKMSQPLAAWRLHRPLFRRAHDRRSLRAKSDRQPENAEPTKAWPRRGKLTRTAVNPLYDAKPSP